MTNRLYSAVGRKIAAGLSLAVCLALAPAPAAQASAVAVAAVPAPIASFTFDNAETGFTSGTGADTARAVVTGTAQYAPSWDGTQAASLPGSATSYMRVYKGETGTSSTLLAGLTEMTVSYDVLAATAGNTGWTFFASNTSGNQARCLTTTGSECYVGILDKPGSVTAERYANGRAGGAQNAVAAYSGTGWKHVDLVLTASATKLYVNGALLGQSTTATMPALSASVGITETFVNIGRANWGTNGEYFAGLLDNFKIYGSALADADIAATNRARDLVAINSLTIPNANAVYQNITVPATSTFGTPITWTSSDPAHLTAAGVVTRPAEGQPNVDVQLTATITNGTETTTKTITATVLSLSVPDPDVTIANVCRTENLSIWATFYTRTTNSAYYYPRRSCDGNTSTFWQNQATTNTSDSLYYEFQSSYLMNQVSVRPTVNIPTSLQVLYRDAVTLEWLPVPTASITPALASNVNSVVTFDQVHASGIQLKMGFTSYAQIAEVVLGPAVVPAPDAATRAQNDLDHIIIPGSGALRSNIELPAAGKLFGSTVTWQSSNPAVVSDQNANGKAAGVVTRGAADQQVTLTATATSVHRGQTRTATKTFMVTVKQAYTMAPTTDYLFSFFTGNESSPTDEQIYFSTSRDGKHYTDLTTAGNPVLRNTLGDRGVRDPYLIRAPEGDKVYMIGTDLLEYARNRWGTNNMSTTYGYASTYLVIWETTDLVHWSEPWLVDVAAPIGDAGMAWAPEAFWDEASGQYLVFWASNTSLKNKSGNTVNQMMATTRDFRTFSTPFTWIDRAEENIDTTMIKVGDWYYRASKTGGNSTSGDIMLERSKNVLAPTLNTKSTGSDNEWVRYTDLRTIFNSNNYTAGQLEGPEFFKFNSDDYPQDTWALMADRYAAGTGYVPFLTTDPGATTSPPWQIDTDVAYGMKTRHGTVLPITTAEYDAIKNAYAAPSVTSVSVAPATTSVVAGQNKSFAATVVVTGGAGQTVTWSVTGAADAGTTVNSAGLLTVAAGETATTLSVRATSTVDSTKSGTATVTVTPAPAITSVAVAPATATVDTGDTRSFAATVVAVGGASQTVTWSVTGAADAGTSISGAGLLTVAAGETATSLTVKATSTVDPTKQGSATVTVNVAKVNSVSVSPSTVTVLKGETKTFSATVDTTGGASQSATWSVTGGADAGTTVSAAGLLTVAAGETATSLTVTATSNFDTSKSGSAMVTLKAAFTDVSSGSQFKDEIVWAAELGLINGYADGTFRPATAVDRQAAAAILYRFTHPGATTLPTCTTAPFTDVPTTSAFCGAIAWMKTAGISTGNVDGTFSPNAAVSRQAMAAFLYRLDHSGPAPVCTEKPFTDIAVTSQFCGEIAWLASSGISEGYADGTFRPGAPVARGALVAFLYRSQEG